MNAVWAVARYILHDGPSLEQLAASWAPLLVYLALTFLRRLR